MADVSMILICLVFSLYPLFAPRGDRILLMCVAVGLLLAGAAVELFLFRKGKKGFWFPVLCVGVEVALEVLYQLNQFKIIHNMRGHAVWEFILFGIVVLYVLLGALVAWGIRRFRF